jgi:hypothetical protein
VSESYALLDSLVTYLRVHGLWKVLSGVKWDVGLMGHLT